MLGEIGQRLRAPARAAVMDKQQAQPQGRQATHLLSFFWSISVYAFAFH